MGLRMIIRDEGVKSANNQVRPAHVLKVHVMRIT